MNIKTDTIQPNTNFIDNRDFYNDDPKIKVIGIGGAGNNIINSLYQLDLSAELISINTDWKQLSANKADKKLLIGLEETKGFGCGGDVIKGKNATLENIKEIKDIIKDTELIIFVGGLGRGTATGALPEIAKIAQKLGALTVAFLTVPFFTLKSEIDKASQTIETLDNYVNTIILLDNNKLNNLHKNMTLLNSFSVMNELVFNSINSLVSIIRENEIIEIDFSNLKSVLDKGGFGTISISGIQKGGNIDELIENMMDKNLSFFDLRNAKTALVKVIGDSTLDLNTINSIAEKLKKYTSDDSEILITAKTDDSLKGAIKLVTIFGGMNYNNVVIDNVIKNINDELFK